MKKITLIFFAFFAFNFGFGQSIFENPITGVDPYTDDPYTNGQIVNPNISVSGIGRGSGISGNTSSNRYNARGWDSPTLDTNDYFEFTLTSNSGYEINFISFAYTGQASGTGPNQFAFRSSIDGYTTNIGTPNETGTTIDLSNIIYQNITAVTFRIYGWGGSAGTGTFSINDFVFNGTVSLLPCPGGTITWDGTNWSNGTGPDLTISAVLDNVYNTSTHGSFSACSLVVNGNLNVGNGTFVEVENDVTINGNIVVETQGNFVQNDDAGLFTLTGTARVNKLTAPKDQWYFYTYWSSPVVDETIGNVFPDVDGDRRFWFNGANFVDTNGDDIDDDNNDWQYAYGGDTMIPGVGYAVTESRFFPSGFGASGTAAFEGEFNTGDVPVPIYTNAANVAPAQNWNFIGNPYPSAIDFDAFYAANSSVVEGAAYFWSQASPPDAGNAGNQNLNFSKNDYAIYSTGSGGVATSPGGEGTIPLQYIPTGQGFFIAGVGAGGTATFTNAMRMADNSSNSQFFKTSGSKGKSFTGNRLWVNLTSDNGVFNQILVAYVDGATNGMDALAYDAPRLSIHELPAALYTSIENESTKFAIQGKPTSSLTNDEIIKLGFSTKINQPTIYSLSLANFEGEFLGNNAVILKDNLLNKVHNLSNSDYSFTSETGVYNDRFEIVFNETVLTAETFEAQTSQLDIINLENDNIRFSVSGNETIKSVKIFDLVGRQLYNLKGKNQSETYQLSELKNKIYIAKVELNSGKIINKKAIK
ncbi:hypothetical protein PK35_15780 [Tamlana nanhaiensis]|uniref:Secretion system C-terminal sorting domain-containing protein n=1 Tax=Neotamlana nanhaiensis TaxID=1382798 RepID=A0A0D7VWT2_9FLAO|nr:T9SS type A sorting domain-containing protein [Tamlana nanhaiensis]KJD31291.1 hypothetical protein PK35_15780 [Tamlana nanhaiensis]